MCSVCAAIRMKQKQSSSLEYFYEVFLLHMENLITKSQIKKVVKLITPQCYFYGEEIGTTQCMSVYRIISHTSFSFYSSKANESQHFLSMPHSGHIFVEFSKISTFFSSNEWRNSKWNVLMKHRPKNSWFQLFPINVLQWQHP